ncbi:MAG: hypothetical protein ABIN97_12260, partial [Ginsengibacter sp.]
MHTDKPNFQHSYCFGFISIFPFFTRQKAFILFGCFLLFHGYGVGQCPDKKVFIEKIAAIYNSSEINSGDKLNKLLELQQQMKKCNLSNDSSFMFLLQKMGVLYFGQSDYTNAIEQTKKSVLIANECIAKNSSTALALIHNYANLFFYYDNTGNIKKKLEAVDSCVLYALKSGSGFDRILVPLSDKTTYLFNKGEYNLCTKNAKLGEDIIQKYYHDKDSITYIVFFIIKRANSLYFSKDFSAAEQLLNDKILQLKRTGNSNQLYAFYSLLGLISNDKKNFTEALALFKKAYQLSLNIKYKNGCAQNLAFAGTLYAQHFNAFDTGLKYCKMALKYAEGAPDSLSILHQIGNIYALKGMYNKAQYFFQYAFDVVQKGMNESALLQNSFQYPGFNLLQNLSDLITSKGNA